MAFDLDMMGFGCGQTYFGLAEKGWNFYQKVSVLVRLCIGGKCYIGSPLQLKKV